MQYQTWTVGGSAGFALHAGSYLKKSNKKSTICHYYEIGSDIFSMISNQQLINNILKEVTRIKIFNGDNYEMYDQTTFPTVEILQSGRPIFDKIQIEMHLTDTFFAEYENIHLLDLNKNKYYEGWSDNIAEFNLNDLKYSDNPVAAEASSQHIISILLDPLTATLPKEAREYIKEISEQEFYKDMLLADDVVLINCVHGILLTNLSWNDFFKGMPTEQIEEFKQVFTNYTDFVHEEGSRTVFEGKIKPGHYYFPVE